MVTAVITLYGIIGAASLAPRICLEAAGAEYRFVEPERDPAAPGPPEFVAASPHLQVPALVDGALTLTESAAIVMYLADRFPDAGLAPAVGTPERADWYRWLCWLQNTPMPALYQWFYPERYCGDPDHEESIRAHAVIRLDRMFDWLDADLGGRSHLVGGRFSGADAYLWMLSRWTRNMPRPAFARPNLARFWAAGREHPAIASVIALENL